MTDPAIKFSAVHRHFGTHAVLRDLSFAVEPGQIYALLGRNGSGKSTALRILLGFLRPHAGETAVLGKDSTALGPTDRAAIGFVGENHRLYPSMRVRDVLAFERETRPGFDADYAARALRRCELPDRRPTALLSRGQRAQLALLVALAGRPRVLICDDPALGLDAVARREVLDVMIDLLAQSGSTVLYSSHFLHDVERVADRIGILHGGRLIVDATMDELKARVQRRLWTPRNGEAPPANGVLCARRARHRYELTLLDLDETRIARLNAGGARLDDEWTTPTLEELFCDLTTAPDRTPFPTPTEHS